MERFNKCRCQQYEMVSVGALGKHISTYRSDAISVLRNFYQTLHDIMENQLLADSS